MNVQYAIKDGDIYVLEVNPRASRTVPFVAKVIGLPVAKIAARVMAGEKLAGFKLAATASTSEKASHSASRKRCSRSPASASGRHRARPGDEIDRRGDGPRPRLRRRLRQEPARRRRAAAHAGHRVRLGPRRGQGPRCWSRWTLPDRLRRDRHIGNPALPGGARGRADKSTKWRKAGPISSTPSKTAGSSWFSTPPRGPRPWPTAVPAPGGPLA